MFHSGLVSLDSTLAEGEGLPPGSLLEVCGVPDSGKTGLALWYCRTTLEDPNTVVGWIATEAHLSSRSLEWAGISPDRFVMVNQSPNIPGLKAAKELVDAGCDIVVIDSIAALIGEEIEPTLPMILSRGLPPLKRLAKEKGSLVIFTNQERSIGPGKIVMSAGASPALLRSMDYRVRLHTGENLYRGGLQKGVRVHFEVIKNGEDLDSVGKKGRLSIYWDRGYRDLKSILIEAGRLQNDGSDRII